MWEILIASHGFDLGGPIKGGHLKVCSAFISLARSLLKVYNLSLILYLVTVLTFPSVSCYPFWNMLPSSTLLKLLLGVVLYINPYISLHLFQVACDSLADTVFNTVWTLGCRPFMNSQGQLASVQKRRKKSYEEEVIPSHFEDTTKAVSLGVWQMCLILFPKVWIPQSTERNTIL